MDDIGYLHDHGDGVPHRHDGAPTDVCIPPLTHGHTHTQTKNVLNRLSRAIGHLESVRRMVEDGRDCAEVLTQLAAVRAALGSTGKLIIKDHIQHCIVDAVEYNDGNSLDELITAIEHFI
ncbi:MAG: metal-sensing transcriptional repressor [Clostridia bacterium]